MNRILIFFIGLLFVAASAPAQAIADTTHQPGTDTLPLRDSLISIDSAQAVSIKDSVHRKIINDRGLAVPVPLYSFRTGGGWQLKSYPPGFVFKQEPVIKKPGIVRKVKGKDTLFYLLVLLFIFFATLRTAFPKYFSDLFRLFFKTTMKQRQIREQLMQTPLPSLLLNGFFVISAGLYITFLLQHFNINPVGNFWLLFLYCGMGLSAAYFIKFAGLKICGWLLNLDEAANSYIFIVFIVNKMIGILLLPFLVVLAFATETVYNAGLTLSWCLLGGLLIYRFILTYTAVRNQVKFNPFHFFLYVCAFEIAPLLLVYKALLIFFNQTT